MSDVMDKGLKFPCILLIKGKYGDRRFFINSHEEKDAIALKVVTERFNEGWYEDMKVYELKPLDEMIMDDCGLTIEAIKNLPPTVHVPSKYYDVYIKEIRNKNTTPDKYIEVLEKMQRQFQRRHENYNKVHVLINDGNGALASKFIEFRAREGYQYEGWDVERFENRDDIKV
jgi:hypothetical protein